MKFPRFLIPAFFAACALSSCTKSFECRCMLTDKTSGLDNGSRVIRMDLNGLNARKKAMNNCQHNEDVMNTSTQTAECTIK